MEKIATESPECILDCQDALIETVRTMSGMVIEPGWKMEKKPDFCGTMFLQGDPNCLLTVSAPKETASLLVSYMTGMEESELDLGTICDGMAELSNIVAGFAKSRQASKGHLLSLTSPLCVAGSSLHIVTKASVGRSVADVGSSELQFRLEVMNFV